MPTPIEDEFILMWRACGHLGTAPFRVVADYVLARPSARRELRTAFGCGAWESALLMQRVAVTEPWKLTPRGADLLATADAIGYDPTAKTEPAPEPATRECPGCKGNGRVSVSRSKDRTISELVHGEPAEVCVLPGWDMACGTCKGACVVPALRVSLSFKSNIGGFMNIIETQVSRWAAVTGVPPRVLDSMRNIAPLDGMDGTTTTPACRENAARRRRAESILRCFVFDYPATSERPQ